MLGKVKAAELVNETWEYQKDGLIDRWSFKSPGDCENYALLILKAMFGSERAAKDALWEKQASIWYAVTNNGIGHAVLEYNGFYICNRTKHWVESPDDLAPCDLKWRFPRLLMSLRMAIG
jgi:hypothetical protein